MFRRRERIAVAPHQNGAGVLSQGADGFNGDLLMFGPPPIITDQEIDLN